MPRAGLDRAVVVAHALAVVDAGGRTGFADLSLAAVAARAGVAVPSLYKHVRGLPDLRTEVALRCVEELGDVLDGARDGATGAVALRRMTAATRAWARGRPGRYDAVQSGGWAVDGSADDVRAAAARAVDLLATAVAELGVPAERRIDAVRAVRAALHGFVVLELTGGFGMPDDVDASFDYLVGTLVSSLAGPRDASPAPTAGASPASGASQRS